MSLSSVFFFSIFNFILALSLLYAFPLSILCLWLHFLLNKQYFTFIYFISLKGWERKEPPATLARECCHGNESLFFYRLPFKMLLPSCCRLTPSLNYLYLYLYLSSKSTRIRAFSSILQGPYSPVTPIIILYNRGNRTLYIRYTKSRYPYLSLNSNINQYQIRTVKLCKKELHFSIYFLKLQPLAVTVIHTGQVPALHHWPISALPGNASPPITLRYWRDSDTGVIMSFPYW